MKSPSCPRTALSPELSSLLLASVFCTGAVSGWTLLTAVLGMAGGTDNISPLAFAVIVVGSALGGPLYHAV